MEEKEKSSGGRRTRRTSVAVGVLLIAIVLFIAVTPAMAEPVEVRVTAQKSVEEGETFVVTIDVDSVTDLNSAQFDLSFDPDVVEVSDVEEGEINGEEMPISMWILNPDKDTVKVLAVMPIGEAVSGSGYVAEIEFEVKGDKGEKSELNLSNGKLYNISAKRIEAVWQGAEITIGEIIEEGEEEEEEEEEPTPTPTLEPGVTPTPAPEANVTVTPSPTPTLAPGETPAPTPTATLAPGETPLPTAPGVKPTAKPTAPPEKKATSTPTPEEPGFQAVLAIVGIVAIAYILLRRR